MTEHLALACRTRGPQELLELICDDGSLSLFRTRARSRLAGGPPGDGVLGGAGEIDGRPIACFAQDASFLGGSLGEAHADTIVHVLRLARDARVPVIGCVASAGARLQEGVAALDGYGRIFNEQVQLGGLVPQISYIAGTAAGGGAYSPALTDFVVMRGDAAMFLTGPRVVRQVLREDVDGQTLGGPQVHARNGVAQLEAASDHVAALLIRDLLSYLPQEATQLSPRQPPREPPAVDLDGLVPAEPRQVYDIRALARALVDGGELLEIASRWATNMVTALARLDGRAVGIVANQPRRLGGTIDGAASEKAARFVSLCDGFRLPLVVLVDTPGFLPGRSQEARGVIRAGASLIRAFATASVPRVTVVLRKAYGGAYITMNSKALGAQLAFAWPQAEVGVMGAQQAVRITHRRELATVDDRSAALTRLSDAYADRHLSAHAAAHEGFVDEVIDPRATRERLVRAFTLLAGRRRRFPDHLRERRRARASTHALEASHRMRRPVAEATLDDT